MCTGGTADIRTAEEAARTVEFFGAAAERHFDVGVAGIHRLFARLEAIRRADLLVVGTPTYWGGMAARLKLLFERLVPVFMGESPRGIPQPRLKGRQAVVIAACTTPWPFNLLFRQSRGAVRSVREVLSTGGMRIRSVEIAGTKALDGHLPEAARRKIERLVERVLKTK